MGEVGTIAIFRGGETPEEKDGTRALFIGKDFSYESIDEATGDEKDYGRSLECTFPLIVDDRGKGEAILMLLMQLDNTYEDQWPFMDLLAEIAEAAYSAGQKSQKK